MATPSAATLNALRAVRHPQDVPGTSLTLSLADAARYLNFSNGAAKTLTVPGNEDVPFMVGTEIPLRNTGAGTLAIVPAPGVAIAAPAGGSLALAQNMTAMLYCVTPNTWHLLGQVVLA